MRIPLLSKFLPVLSGSFRFLKRVISVLIFTIIIFTMSFIGVYLYFAKDLPEIRSLEDYQPPVISEVFAQDGTKIGEFWTECRIYYPFEKIPKLVWEAFLASEDARFFEHKGVDMRSIFRAVVANIKAGGVAQGGSTITQQITRSLLLTRERTLNRKIKEAILATRLERRLSKEQILTLYLNQIYLGNRAYGVGAAARNYFHKNLDELTLGQIALLAGLPTAPSTFSPINNPEKARLRQEHVLKRMHEENIITEKQMDDALAEEFEIYFAGIDKDFNDEDASYFIEHVRREVKDKYGDDVLYHQGLKIYTTVDMDMQRAAMSAIHKGLEEVDHRRYSWRGPIEHIDKNEIEETAKSIQREIADNEYGRVIYWPDTEKSRKPRKIKIDPNRDYKAIITDNSDREVKIQIGDTEEIISPKGYQWTRKSNITAFEIGDIVLVRKTEDGSFLLTQTPKIQGALFSMDPHSGFVKAIIGGYDFSDSEFNRATQALRQPGSSIKPFVYAAALDKGYTFDTTIMDSPVVFRVGINQFWSPKNYGGGYKGPTPFQNCLKFSRNVPTVKITFDIGMHYLTGYMRKLGFTTQIDKYLSMALGANVVSLSEMVPAYSTFVSNGVYHKPITITKIVDNKGKVLEEVTDVLAMKPTIPPSPVLSPEEMKRDEMDFVSEIDTTELNNDLFEVQKGWIVKDRLVLSDIDQKTLFGNSIPKGHVLTPQTAYLMVNLLKGVVEGGTGTRLRALGKPSGGKTGTTNDETDAWFISIMPNLVSGVWVGFDQIKKIGPGATGSNTAAPIVLEYLQQVTKDQEAQDFIPPEGFPVGQMASLTGGSTVEGITPAIALPGEYGGDFAGEFFERDLEFGSESTSPQIGYDSYPAPASPPPPQQPAEDYRSYPDF